jgi:hypothetical protein
VSSANIGRATPPAAPLTEGSSPGNYEAREFKEVAEIAVLLLDLVKRAQIRAEEIVREREGVTKP